MKYVEPIKSIILVLLVLLSITFTFSIWTSTPNLEPIEQLPTVDISIAEQMDMDKIILPYKIILSDEEGLKGTFTSEEINEVMDEIEKWRISGLTLMDHKFSKEKEAEILRHPNRFSLYFQGEVPLPLYDKVLNIEDTEIPETSFDRIVVDWDPESQGGDMSIYFMNHQTRSLYKAKAKVDERLLFQQSLLSWKKGFADYVDVSPEDHSSFITVPVASVETERTKYFQEELSPNRFRDSLPNRFRDALFTDPNAVRRIQVDAVTEEYGDDHALMSIDTERKMLSYVMPAAQSHERAVPSELLEKTIDFVNEHSGWTSEFRYTFMNPSSRYVKFQLYVHGLPVYSDASNSTEIIEFWGDNRVFRYIRPYYTLDLTLMSETETIYLKPGKDVFEEIREQEGAEADEIEEMIPGYYMERDVERRLFTMEPYWFYLKKGNWIRMENSHAGGGSRGLE